jgi:hypothetical protein
MSFAWLRYYSLRYRRVDINVVVAVNVNNSSEQSDTGTSETAAAGEEMGSDGEYDYCEI